MKTQTKEQVRVEVNVKLALNDFIGSGINVEPARTIARNALLGNFSGDKLKAACEYVLPGMWRWNSQKSANTKVFLRNYIDGEQCMLLPEIETHIQCDGNCSTCASRR